MSGRQPPSREDELVQLLESGLIQWNGGMLDFVGADRLCELINSGGVRKLDPFRVYEHITKTPSFYRPDMAKMLEVYHLEHLIKAKHIPYSHQVGEKIGAELLVDLLMDDSVKYESRMAVLLGSARLLKLANAGKIQAPPAPVAASAPILRWPENDYRIGAAAGLVTLRNGERKAYGRQELCLLVMAKAEPYNASFDAVLGGNMLQQMIIDGTIVYAPHMDTTLGVGRLAYLIINKKVAYEPRMDATFGANRLCHLIMDGTVDYHPRMDALLGEDLLVRIVLAKSSKETHVVNQVQLLPSGLVVRNETDARYSIPPVGPPCTGAMLVDLVRRGNVIWRDEWADRLSADQLADLVTTGRIRYHPSFALLMGSGNLVRLISTKKIAYDADMDSVLGGSGLVGLINGGRIQYSPRMKHVLGNDRLAMLIENEAVEYEADMDDVLKEFGLYKLIKHGRVRYEPRMHHISSDRLASLIIRGHVAYRPEMDAVLHGRGLAHVIKSGKVRYEERMLQTLRSCDIAGLIRSRHIKYSWSLIELLDGSDLIELIEDQWIKYTPDLNAKLGPERLGRIKQEHYFGSPRPSSDDDMPALVPNCTGRDLVNKIKSRELVWEDEWAPAVGPDALRDLLEEGLISYRPSYASILGEQLEYLIVHGYVAYNPEMAKVLKRESITRIAYALDRLPIASRSRTREQMQRTVDPVINNDVQAFKAAVEAEVKKRLAAAACGSPPPPPPPSDPERACPICFGALVVSEYYGTPCGHGVCAKCFKDPLFVKQTCCICRRPTPAQSYVLMHI